MIIAIKYFLEVAATSNFTRAAWNLNIAPSIITKKIKSLEDKIGYKLFNRTTRKVTLTPEGELFLKRAQLLISEYNHIFDAIDPTAVAPVIKIASNYILAKHFIIQFIPEFTMKYPKVKFEFTQENSPTSITQGKTDLAIGVFTFDLPHLVKTVIFKSKRRLFASPDYIKKYGMPKTPRDLLQHNCLINLITHPDKTWRFHHDEIHIDPRLSTNESSILIEAALQGIGIVNSAEEVLVKYINSGELVPIKMSITEENEETHISLIHQKLPKGHIVREFAEFISKKAHSMCSTLTRK